MAWRVNQEVGKQEKKLCVKAHTAYRFCSRNTQKKETQTHESIQNAISTPASSAVGFLAALYGRLGFLRNSRQLKLSHTAMKSCWLLTDRVRRRGGGGGGGSDRSPSVAAAAAVPAAVGVSRRGLAVFGPPAEDLVGAVVAAATGHAGRGLVDLKL